MRRAAPGSTKLFGHFDAAEAADDPCQASRGHVEAFQAWMIDSRSASTALDKHKCPQQFFRWLVEAGMSRGVKVSSVGLS